MRKKTVWTRERCEILRSLYHNTLNRELAEMLGVSERAVSGQACKMRLKKDQEFMAARSKLGQFKKHHTPFNKGRKQKDWMPAESIDSSKKTRFKKGRIPHNTKQDYYERIDDGGYIYIKAPGSKKMVLKHRWIWEQHHGKIPKGYNIQFKDGNRLNCDIENLYIISRNEQMKQNSYHRYPKEVARIFQLKGALTRQINKAKSSN